MSLRTTVIIVFIFLAKSIFAQYSIKGNVNLSDDWQPKIYIATINKLSDYYRTSPDIILKSAPISSDGTFVLEGKNLPRESRFYRLYLMKKQNTDYDACLYVGGDDHNFIHIVLKNGESLEIQSDSTSQAPFGKYKVKGQKENHLMLSLADIMFPSFYFYRMEFPNELKMAEDDLHIDLKNFADTCSNTLVALAAINNTDFDEYFDENKTFYLDFGQRLKKELPHSIYTKNYLLKIKYYANEEDSFPSWAKLLLGLLSILCFGLSAKLFQSQNRIQILEKQLHEATPKSTTPPLSLDELLTQKEKEILQLISQGRSNKEIASELFVELSTVKTHINKIYSKIGASNRKEAQTLAKRAFQPRV